jgi:solute carrier family 25 uncoupling protein 27
VEEYVKSLFESKQADMRITIAPVTAQIDKYAKGLRENAVEVTCALLSRYVNVESSFVDMSTDQAVGALVSGLVSATVSTPFDVIKTRMMNQPREAPLYSGPLDCVVKTVRAEGATGLYKGFLPAYSRLAPHRMVHFLALEQLTRLAGVGQM